MAVRLHGADEQTSTRDIREKGRDTRARGDGAAAEQDLPDAVKEKQEDGRAMCFALARIAEVRAATCEWMARAKPFLVNEHLDAEDQGEQWRC